MAFRYDASGNRITKIIKNNSTNPEDWTYTFYARDASGNIMSIYNLESNNYRLTERPIFGSSREGLHRPNLELGTQNSASSDFTDYSITRPAYALDNNGLRHRTLGQKNYEITDHLGNLRAAILDQRMEIAGEHYPVVTSLANYYPFGLQMHGRKYNAEDYRFGFNGKENDQEWGSQVIQDYGFRLYNPSLGKFLSVDPLALEYPWYTPYQFAGNLPIWAVDIDGLEPGKTNEGPNEICTNCDYSHTIDDDWVTVTASRPGSSSSSDTRFLDHYGKLQDLRSKEPDNHWKTTLNGKFTIYNTTKEVYGRATSGSQLEKELLQGKYGQSHAGDYMKYSVLKGQGDFNVAFGNILMTATPLGESIGLLGGRYLSLIYRPNQYNVLGALGWQQKRNLRDLIFPNERGWNIGKSRLSDTELRSLSRQFDREFALVYRMGSGKNGGGGNYWLYSGSKYRVPIGHLDSKTILIAHTHPFGAFLRPSKLDYVLIKNLNISGQKSSKILHQDGRTAIFTLDGWKEIK